MKLSLRSYPHPVVGNRDDVPGAAFQAALEMSTDRQLVYIDTTVMCSSSTLLKFIENSAATYVLHVECSNTLFRRTFDFRTSPTRIAVPADHLNDAVEVNVFVRAAIPIPEYRVDGAHPDYDGASFDVDSGDILAVAEGQVFHIESSFDSLARIGSIMQIRESSEPGDLPMRVDYNGDKIVIFLAKQDFADYQFLKNLEPFAGPLTTTIVLPVLADAIHLLKSGEEDERRWIRLLQRRIGELGVSKTEALEAAQRILELPVKRALGSARMNVEAMQGSGD